MTKCDKFDVWDVDSLLNHFLCKCCDMEMLKINVNTEIHSLIVIHHNILHKCQIEFTGVF